MRLEIPDNQIYYFRVGNGDWKGKFSFRLDHWKAFWRDSIGLKYRVLTLGMVLMQKILGASTILSSLRIFPEWGPNGVATNIVRIKKFGLTIYVLKEQYVLHPDGTKLFVHSRERFGPIPFLFRTSKHHPARVHKAGSGATYLDMPLLGTLWEGDYQVLDDGDQIDAMLTCEWGSAREVISRVSARSKTEPAISRATHPVTDLDGVIDRLGNYRDWYDATHNPLAVFTHAYLTITENFRQEIPKAGFNNQDWVLALDVAFANEFFRNANANSLGEEVSKGWEPVFDTIKDGKTSVLEELALAMVAHIIHDLPLALKEVQMRQGDQSMVHDYHLANDVLELGIDQIQQAVARRYNPLLSWMDRVAASSDEVLTNYGIRLARAIAWYNGERLLDPESEGEALESIAKSISTITEKFRRPPLLSMRIFLWVARWISRSTRIWPTQQKLYH